MRTYLAKVGTFVGFRVSLILLFLLITAVSSSISNANVNIETAADLAGQSCVTLPPDIVSWWSGEGDAQDKIGGNHGTLQGGTTFTSGNVGQAFSFDGVNDFVSVPFNENYNFDPNGQFTIEAWVKPQPNNLFQAILVKSPVSPDSWDWGLWLDGNNRFLSGLHLQHILISGTVAQTDIWYHVAVTYNNSSWKMYVNGVLEDEHEGTSILQSGGGLALGRKGESTFIDAFYQGEIDEMSLYSRALTAVEVQVIFNAGSAGKCSRIFLPVVLNNYVTCYLFSEEKEDNDETAKANGPLCPNQTITGYPDDVWDIFTYYHPNDGQMTIDLTNHVGTDVDLFLYNSVPILQDDNAPYQIVYTGQASLYYIAIHNPVVKNNSTLYTLTVSTP